MNEYEPVIGLETHIQLKTESKIFCGCRADSWFDPPNSNICPVCTGLPGVLPAINERAVEQAMLLALAMSVDELQPVSYFARKNYFYPDLPKGYQISQYDEPLARGGLMVLPLADGASLKVRIAKLHLEEDAGKTVHQTDQRLIDFNRCGVPLVEMVTEPDLRSADEAATYLIRLRQLLRWLDVSDADMERGQLRCDANVSIRPVGSDQLNTKTEIKNVNSIEAVRQAIETEIARQVTVVESGGQVEPWTLEWDEDSGTLRKMRSKETEADYRYFREPDLLPLHIDEAWLARIKQQLPELPLARRARFIEAYGLPAYDAEILTEERSLADFFEATVAAGGHDVKVVSNWLMNDVLRLIREKGVSAGGLQLRPEHLSEILAMLADEQINMTTAKELVERTEESGESPRQVVEREGLGQVSDRDSLVKLARRTLEASPEQVADYRGGKQTLIGWFVGQLMRQTGGKANPQLARQVLEELLAE
ncbi:MAG TPA: Asp-tRNA(Asn)/Glu-tRNA(Gln) amidotransferase subunit GatB [Anaerolineales bacterium]